MESWLFFLSKTLGVLLLPSSLVLLLLIISIMMAVAARRHRHRQVPAGVKWLFRIAVLLIALVATTPFANTLLRHLEQNIARPTAMPRQIDGIILLGGFLETNATQHYAQPVFNHASERLFAFNALAKQYPSASLLFTGGSADLTGAKYREADLLNHYAVSLNMPAARMQWERDSRNTYENARQSALILRPQPNQHFMLITSAAHMPRAMAVFKKAGFTIIPYPVDYRAKPHPPWIHLDFIGNLAMLDYVTKEYIGQLFYQLTGRV